MTPSDSQDQRTTAFEKLLRRLHEQSTDSPERSPFWREDGWRCEFHKQGGPPRLKVFKGEECVHEEVVQGRAAEDRCYELRDAFLSPASRSKR